MQFYYVVNFGAFWISLATKHDIPNFWQGNSKSKSQGLCEEINKIRCEYIKREIQSRYKAGTASCQMTGNGNSREITLESSSQCQGAGLPPTRSESVLFYVDFTYSKIYGQICQTTDIETWRENVHLLSFNTVILHNTNDQTFLSVELQQNNDELSISNFFFYLEVLEIKYE